MDAKLTMQKIIDNINQVIIGKEDVVELLTIALACDSHVLIEDVPGVGKTTLVSALAKSIDSGFNRIQFTPDVMPSDIVGFSMYNPKLNDFEYKMGALSTNIILADEINRTSPKTQSSLLEAMEERQISIDGNTIMMEKPFMILATQNPIEYLGTYPLPEAQIDRFIMKISIGYPTFEAEKEILKVYTNKSPLIDLQPVVDKADVIALQQSVKDIHAEEVILDYIVYLVAKTRDHEQLALGVSPRGAIYLLEAAKAWALYQGRTYVIPDDVKKVYLPVMSHRVLIRNEAKYDRISKEALLLEILDQVAVPEVKPNA